MKLALAALMMLTVLPAHAGGPRFRESIGDRSNRQAYESQSGYARQEKCYKRVYREEYVPGTMKNPGYVKSYKERVEVPCKKRVKVYQEHHHPNVGHGHVDDNSCIEGSIIGGIAGGGAGAAMSRGDGRWWAIPLGIVSGAMVGCQVDGG
mgnify:CR=1 FL=1|tara:strand:+ start:780 stop:1229 length:450 start_codon:yes stop_codon:yes gene_type:complete